MKTLKFSFYRLLTYMLCAGISLGFAPVYAQELMKVKHSCNFDGEESEADHYTFEASAEAAKIISTLVQANGLSASSFILKESNCKNALATTDNKKRYILYNPVFLQKFKMDTKSKWVGYCVLAHEIAHHLNGHDLETDDPSVRKRQELEADKYAGHWLFKMGATLEEAQAGIHAIPLENETKTHPPKNARLVAVTNGWTKAKELGGSTPPTLTPPTSKINETNNREPKNIVVPTGSLRCGECMGYGFNKGQRYCQDCGGNGRTAKKVSCKTCNGTAKIQVNCSTCNGSGKWGVSGSQCPACKGTGKDVAECKMCSGKSYILDLTNQEDCRFCKSTGKVEADIKCGRCKGKGFVKAN